MKKILTLLIALVILLCSCGKQETPTETDAPTESESVPTSEQTDPAPAPTEPTSEPTAPTQPEPTDPAPTEPPKDDLSYYPYRLLDMTYGEIEEMFGELTKDFGIAGGSCPYIPQLKIFLEYSTPFYEEIPDDEKPRYIFMWDPMDKDIYPGLNVGMSANEIPKSIQFDDDWGITGSGDNSSRYYISTNVDSYRVLVLFRILEEVLDELGDITERSEEDWERFNQWGNEYRKNILNSNEKIVEIDILLK